MSRYILTAVVFSALALAQPPAGRGPGGAGRGGPGGPGSPGAGGGRGPAAQPATLVLNEKWKQAEGNVLLTQEFVTDPDLTLAVYGSGNDDLHITSEGNTPHIWSGGAVGATALTLSSKENFLDLTGKGRIRWYLKTSGFHDVRPVVKLADGNFYVGDHTDASPYDYREFDFYLAEVHWIKLDMPKVQTKNKLLDKIDLSKVDAVGYADLQPGSGHGDGGYSDMAWIEVYGKAVPRDAK